jgi:ABC-2 type transport system ATP-binding protein
MIRIENLTKRFGNVTAVDDLSFEVERGEVLGFLGPNGAGKTTTMRVLTGFVPATSGRVFVADHDIFEEPLEAKRRIGYLPESVPVYPEMSVESYLYFVTELKGLEKSVRRREVEQAMELTDITDRRNRVVGHLSKGLKKRVGIAQALLGEPYVLVLDEPTEGLDPNQVRAIRELVTNLSSDRTVIVSTHILSEVEQTCSRVLIIDHGRAVMSDSVENIRRMGRGAVVTLRVAAGADRVREAVAGVPGVARLEVERNTDDVSGFTLSLTDPGATPALAAAIVKAGLPLVEMRQEGESLEDVFVRLTHHAEPSSSGGDVEPSRAAADVPSRTERGGAASSGGEEETR